MKRRTFVGDVAASSAAVFLPAHAAAARGPAPAKPTKVYGRLVRLNNFNVEFSCTVSRAAMLTGRYAARTGAEQNGGMTLWEITIPEALKPLGYATALFGKWHLGGLNWLGKRAPTDQGFDEWYGIPMSSNEAQTTTLPGYDSTKTPAPYIWEGKAGEVSKKVKPFDMITRRTIDREAAERSIAFMERNVRQSKPAEGRRPWRGTSGPWSGFYNTVMEGGESPAPLGLART